MDITRADITISTVMNYVPQNRSPKSPNPGTIYLCSFNPSSIAAVIILTCGYFVATARNPSGADIIDINRIFVGKTPFDSNMSIAVIAEPPVAICYM